MNILNKPLAFKQIKGITVTASDDSFCLTPLVSVFETAHLDEVAGEADYKMVIQAYIPTGSKNVTIDTDTFGKLIPIDTPIKKETEARWIVIKYDKPTDNSKLYDLWSCNLELQTLEGDIDCAFYTYTVTNDKDDPRTKRGTVTTVRNSGSGH